MQGIELAMLFCHAGFSVKTILLDGAEEQISSELLKEITGHAPWSKSHKPNWVKAEINYPVGIVFEPTEEILKTPSVTALHSQCSPLRLAMQSTSPNQRFGEDLHDSSLASRGASEHCNDDIFAEYIKEHCGFIKFLVNKESSLNKQSEDIKEQIIILPDNPLNLRSLFERILSESVALTAAKALDGGINYCFEGDFSKIDYVKDLEKAFAEAGMEIATASVKPRNDVVVSVAPHCIRNDNAVDEGIENDWIATASTKPRNDEEVAVVSSRNKRIEIVFEAREAEIEPTKNRIYVSKHKNGLLLIDSIETRLLPDFSCQSCYSRLVNYLKVELTRLD